ncbi:MAG: ATP-binding cassette domain-containing protein, partial [Planctomycetes bacterium]|nr:ATP-binding cassette domain-containing protein [Planctomycetota bacterium]
MRGIGKQFGGVSALEDVEIELSPGQIHGLVGENGAGKSTLVNIATGVLQPDAGEIIVDGRPVRMGSPTIAAEYGVIAVHQEADLFEELSLAENMLLGRGLIRNRLGLIDWKSTYSEANAELGFLEEDIDVRETAGRFSIGKRVIAEIAAAVARKPKVLFLDEPTASLTGAESKLVFRQIAELKSTGVSIIY